jgi:hypothetical protein
LLTELKKKRLRDRAALACRRGAHFVQDKFGAATTHWRKLIDRVHRGVGNLCALLLIGLPASIVSFDPSAKIEPELEPESGPEPGGPSEVAKNAGTTGELF